MAYDEYDPWLRDDLDEGDPTSPVVAPTPASDSREAPYGISFWQNRGYSTDQMFDQNGQLRPGWTHTAQGYMYEPPVQTNNAPPPTGGGMSEQEGRDYDARNGLIGGYMTPNGWVSGSPRSGGGGGGASTRGGFSGGAAPSFAGWPSYQAPGFVDPGVFDPGPAFTFREFVGPTAESITSDPGFQFRIDQGRRALEASAAGKGVLRSGGTLKDILGYGQNFASQEYGNVYNRALAEYDTNRNNAADIWGRQYGQRQDVYRSGADRANSLNTFNVGNAQFGFGHRQRQAELDFADLFNRWQQEGNWLRDLSVAGMD